MRAFLSFLFSLFLLNALSVPIFASPSSLTYTGTLIQISGRIVSVNSTDSLRIYDSSGENDTVSIHRGTTYISSMQLLRTGTSVKVIGRLRSGRSSEGDPLVDAEDIESVDGASFSSFSGSPSIDTAPRHKNLPFVLGAAASILVGSGLYVWMKTHSSSPTPPPSLPISSASQITF